MKRKIYIGRRTGVVVVEISVLRKFRVLNKGLRRHPCSARGGRTTGAVVVKISMRASTRR